MTMPELHDLLERRAAGYTPPVDLLERVHERGRQRQRNRKVGTAVAAAAAVVAVAVAGLSQVLPPPTNIVFPPTPHPLVDIWESIDSDGSNQTMNIDQLNGSAFEVVVADDFATVCSGAPSTMTGTGQMEDSGLVIAAPTLICDDGTTPQPVDGSSLEDALQNYTLVHDPDTDTLTDSFGIQWRRQSATPDVAIPEPDASDEFWPQSNLDEVRKAQERADAGDPAYTWQVDRALDNGDFPGDAAIFSRFLTEELEWNGFRCCAERYHGESMQWTSNGSTVVEVDFVRCAGGQPNALYRHSADGSCAPTLDDGDYERVRLTARQPGDGGPGGVWVIQRSVPQPPFRQSVPPSDAEIADVVEPFLQARVDGEGAGQHVDSEPANIPLLYSTSDGKAYERFDYEVLDGPTWPFGIVAVNLRLFADGGKTVVEQPFRLEGGILEYFPHEPTTENGAPVPEPYNLLGGRVTFSADQSWEDVFFGPNGPDVLAYYRRNEYDHLVAVVGDPLTPAGSCAVGDEPPPSADALVRSVRSSPDLSVSAPQPARLGSINALRLDIALRDGAPICGASSAVDQGSEGPAVVAPREDPDNPRPPTWWGVGPDTRARLYAFDVPGKRVHTVAIVVLAPKSEFGDVIDAVQPILDSVEVSTD